MNLRRLALVASIWMTGLVPGVSTGTALARERPVVIELFTSQGCSSCPPAEALLGEYAGRSDVLPLGFHVTYWDRLGWRDPYAFEGATQRQAAYGSQLGSGTSFTPQMVIDGRYSTIGSRRSEVSVAIQKAGAQRGSNVDVTLTREGGGVAVHIGPGGGAARILLIGFDRERMTPVGRGENSGRTIAQSNVVRSLRNIGMWTGRSVDLSEAAPVGQDAAVLLQAPDGRIMGAARL